MLRFALVLFGFIPSARAASELWLGVGGSERIPAPRHAAVRVGSRGHLRVFDEGSHLRLIALKRGATTLVIGGRTYEVRITSARQRRFVSELRELLGVMRGLRLELDDGHVEITGTLLRFDDWSRIAELAHRHAGEYHFRARVLHDVGETAIAKLGALTHGLGPAAVRFVAEPELTAVVPRGGQALLASLDRALAAYGVRSRVAPEDLDVQPLIKTSVILAEVSREAAREFGVRWPGEYEGQVIPSLRGEANVLATLRALAARGHAQLLASPDLSCRSGGEAQFQAGGEIPVRTTTARRTQVEWKNFGVLLKVKPRSDHRGALAIDIRAEISAVDFARAVDGVPALKKTVVESQFDLPGRRTIALSGLLRRDVGTQREGLPVLSQIPILGRLFSSERYRRHESELVVFVTPEVVTPEETARPVMPVGWSLDVE